ncbi:MAG: SDR family NAD(P)-dependent oxidoreductase [Clostridia bacterium]|nr:SDR family NAD(P)-dependent oxidoreductase [Clostridia bacterium]
MKAVVTGASSGIGYEIAIQLSEMGYDIIAVARNKEKLEKLKKECNNNVEIHVVDLSKEKEVIEFYKNVKREEIEILVNNAGFGKHGSFEEIELQSQIDMIEVNIKAVTILTKLFLKDMKRKNRGKILNIGSISGFMPGPLMAEYYATKAYIYILTKAIRKELKKCKSKVNISICCPGPVDTEFNKVANVKFSIKAKSSKFVAKKAIKGMFNNKKVIYPGLQEKAIKIFAKILPEELLSESSYCIQRRKRKHNLS